MLCLTACKDFLTAEQERRHITLHTHAVVDSTAATEGGKQQNFDQMADGLLLLAVKKAKARSAKPYLCSPIHSGMFLLVLENMSKGTSKQSVLHLVHERFAQVLKLSSFSLINNLSSGRDKPSSRSARRNSARIVHITPGLLERDVRVMIVSILRNCFDSMHYAQQCGLCGTGIDRMVAQGRPL